MYRDRLKPKPAFIDYASAAAWLTSMGSSFRGVAEVINRSSAAVVGRWAWIDGAIRPIGPIDFTAVTATQGATIGSVTGQVLDLSDSTFVVTGGYTLRIWNTTDGALVADVAAGSWTRSGAGIDAGAAVAAAVAALIAGGKSIRCWVEGLSELSIGGSTSAIELGAGGILAFDSGAVFPTQTSESALNFAIMSRNLNVVFASYTVPATDGYRVVLGVRNGAEIMWGPIYIAAAAKVRAGMIRAGTINAAGDCGLDLEATNGPHVAAWQSGTGYSAGSRLHDGLWLPIRVGILGSSATIARIAAR